MTSAQHYEYTPEWGDAEGDPGTDVTTLAQGDPHGVAAGNATIAAATTAPSPGAADDGASATPAVIPGDPNRPAAPPLRLGRHISEAVDETRARVEAMFMFPDMGGLSTGIKALDEKIKRVLAPGHLVIVGAGTGGGKSVLVNQLAVEFAAQDDVLSLVLENTDIDSTMRMAANIARIPLSRIRSGFAGEEAIPKEFYDALNYLKTLRITPVDRAGLSVEQWCKAIADWQAGKWDGRPKENGIVFIDQLSHILPSDPNWWRQLKAHGIHTNIPAPPRNSAREDQILGWQTRVLKILAEELGLIIFLVHQLNNSHGEAKPTLASMRGSQEINHAADMVLMPWRPMVESEDDAMDPFAGNAPKAKIYAEDGEAWIICPKSRHSAAFEVKVRWIGALQRFADPDIDANAAYQAPKKQSKAALEGRRHLRALDRKFEAARKLRLGQVSPELQAAAAAPLETAGQVEVKVAETYETREPSYLQAPIPASSAPASAGGGGASVVTGEVLSASPAAPAGTGGGYTVEGGLFGGPPAAKKTPPRSVGGFGGGGRNVVRPDIF